MQHRIDAPAVVADTAGTRLFNGYLGRSAGRKAVELATAGSQPLPSIPQEAQP
jgi:hypothetical protein